MVEQSPKILASEEKATTTTTTTFAAVAGGQSNGPSRLPPGPHVALCNPDRMNDPFFFFFKSAFHPVVENRERDSSVSMG